MTQATLDLVPLQQAIDTEDVGGVQAYLDRLPQRTASEMLRLAGERWGFTTAEVDGVRYMLAKDLAQRLYRDSNTGNLTRLLARYGEELMAFSTFCHDDKMSLRVAFDLHPKDGKTTFATWRHFLVATMKGETVLAREMQRYLMHAEESFRVNTAAEQETGFSVQQLEQLRQITRQAQAGAALAPHDIVQRKITNLKMVIDMRQALGLRVVQSVELALEALAGEAAGLPVTTLAQRDRHYASHFWAVKKKEGWRSTYSGGDIELEKQLGKQATRLMNRYGLEKTTNLQQVASSLRLFDVGMYPWHILEEAFHWFIDNGRVVQKVSRGATRDAAYAPS